MSKFLDNVYKWSVWIIMILSMFAYLAFQILQFNGSLESTLSDWRTYVHLLFVIYLNVTMVAGAYDSGISYGVQSLEFTLADQLNNKIISSANNEMKEFREYVKKLNDHELQSLREDYLFSIGDKKVEKLTEKELKAYNELQPIVHNIYGFNLPLFYEISKNGQVNYAASMKKNEGKTKAMIKKVFIGLLFGSMTINVAFATDNVGTAFVSLAIISVGLITTFLMTYFPQVFKLKYELPKKVILKQTIYNSYIDYKNGTHTLKKLEMEEPKVEETNDNDDNTEPTVVNDTNDTKTEIQNDSPGQ